MKTQAILFYIFLASLLASAMAQETEQNLESWKTFLEVTLTEETNTQSIEWIETNGTLEPAVAWTRFQSDKRITQPIVLGKIDAHNMVLDTSQTSQLSEQTVRLSVSAKQPIQNPARSFGIAYLSDSGNSGWRNFRPTQDWQSYDFTFRVPKAQDNSESYIAISGDFYGENKSTLIRTLKLEVKDMLPETKQELYTIKAGDSLSLIAQQFYGDGNLWQTIYEANLDTIDNPNALIVGNEIVIPLND